MSYGKLAEGLTEKQAREKLSKVMPAVERTESFRGSSPPSVMVGSSKFPKVSAGVLSPQRPGNSEMMDSPSLWYRQGFGIERVASLRTSLVNSRKTVEAEKPDSLDMELKELAMAGTPVDVEVELKSSPRRGGTAGRVKPVSCSGDLDSLNLGENPSVRKAQEDLYYDTDARAETAIRELYSGSDVYDIQQSLSAGIIGREEDRSLVPTRWSITATDDTVSKMLRNRVQSYQELGDIRMYEESYLGNKVIVFLVPGSWEFELVELKRPRSVWNSSGETFAASNHESFSGRTSYAESTAGAYYAARLGALEHLNDIGRQAKALVVRDVRPDYWAPLGVWVVREVVRNCFEHHEVLESFGDVLRTLSSRFTIHFPKIKVSSTMLSGRQSSVKEFGS